MSDVTLPRCFEPQWKRDATQVVRVPNGGQTDEAAALQSQLEAHAAGPVTLTETQAAALAQAEQHGWLWCGRDVSRRGDQGDAR